MNEALVDLNRSRAMPPWVRGYLAACYALTEQMNEAAMQVEEARCQAPDFSVRQFLTKEPFKRPADRDRLREGLLKAGLPE
jgi:hypothetical protein